MRTKTLFFLMILITFSVSIAAQSDEFAPVNTLLDQAEAALNDDDLTTAQAFIVEANALISADMVAECPTLTAAKSLLEQSASAEMVDLTRSLLVGARALIDGCVDDTSTPTDDELGREPVTRNADWTPIEREFDGVMMVLVPTGCFMMGEDGDGGEQCFDEPFWIGQTEVTNAQYGSIGCSEWSSEPDQPRNCVSWFDAHDFCEVRGGRLPTEAEWEYVARGPDGWIYPWGDEFIADNASYSGNSDGHTVDVSSYPDGASWVGALDIAGNVWEWTNSLFEPYPYDLDDGREADTGNRIDIERVLRGGAFFNTSDNLRTVVRFGGIPNFEVDFIGFRCARSS